jgi:hypothetical protein
MNPQQGTCDTTRQALAPFHTRLSMSACLRRISAHFRFRNFCPPTLKTQGQRKRPCEAKVPVQNGKTVAPPSHKHAYGLRRSFPAVGPQRRRAAGLEDYKTLRTFIRFDRYTMYIDHRWTIEALCATLSISRATCYRYVALARRAASEGERREGVCWA